MTDALSFLALLQQYRAIAVLRCQNLDQALPLALALAAGGLRLMEVTWNSPCPGPLLTQLRQSLPHCQIGAGTLLSMADLEAARAAGAAFAFSPHTDQAMVTWAINHGLPFVPGALTPSEIVTAWQAGATAVKVFPITAVGGVAYLRSLGGPLDNIPLVPTGGVSLENAPQLLAAGAIAVGLSTALCPPDEIARGDWPMITTRAQTLVESLKPFTHDARGDQPVI
ncbi:MAG: bifunctional 4-hydroxy-2-oxoglutarate aldolase/2-dehydro-3-deoxy-phosphogluconate aldolase [Nodosilinea sp.]